MSHANANANAGINAHSVVLLSDGERIAAERHESAADAVTALRALLARATGPGCHRLSVMGPRVNGALTIDGPSRAEHAKAGRERRDRR